VPAHCSSGTCSQRKLPPRCTAIHAATPMVVGLQPGIVRTVSGALSCTTKASIASSIVTPGAVSRSTEPAFIGANIADSVTISLTPGTKASGWVQRGTTLDVCLVLQDEDDSEVSNRHSVVWRGIAGRRNSQPQTGKFS